MGQVSFLTTSLAVEAAKASCHISKDNSEMTDDDIRAVCHWIADRAPDTVMVDNKPEYGRVGREVMLFIAITEFPWFYDRYELAQFN